MEKFQRDSIAARLFEAGHDFGFFQAVRLLEKLDPRRKGAGRATLPAEEAVRFRALVSLAFPPSTVYEVQNRDALPPVMAVTFLGLVGPNGVLPRHYTEILLKLQRDNRGPERYALRDWLDLFNHRSITLFYRAWEKYRFFIPFERGEHRLDEPDAFTQSLFSLVGLGTPGLRSRLRISHWDERRRPSEQPLARIEDLGLLHYAGLLAHRPKNAVSLAAFLQDYFQLPVEVRQFQGQWLQLEIENQTSLGLGNIRLGQDTVAGERVWDVQGKIRIRIGPLDNALFTQFLPDRAPRKERKAFFLLLHLVRFYVGPELTFDVQLVLRAADIPECSLSDDGGVGPRLGWNTWLRSQEPTRDADDAMFEGEEIVWLNPH